MNAIGGGFEQYIKQKADRYCIIIFHVIDGIGRRSRRSNLI